MTMNMPGYNHDAADFFSDIRRAVGFVPEYNIVYRRFDEVFSCLLGEQTASKDALFTGKFAKTDYLLKHHHADTSQTRAVNDLRVRLGTRANEQADLNDYWQTDMQALCEFVALIFHESVPADLIAKYPKEPISRENVSPKRDCMRLIVKRWDDAYLYGSAEDGDGVEQVKVCYSRDCYSSEGIDFLYLKDLLYEGARINVVAPMEDEGMVYGRFLIFEPDYLVNVQSVASCFTPYANSPLVYIFKLLGPSTTSDAIILGNFAGLLLDKALRGDAQDYAKSVGDFYKDNALALLDLKDSDAFHEEAKRQMSHIWKVMEESLPKLMADDFKREQGVVEPSFFSEMLGLQGRMDFLQMDFQLLMEQKSGNGEWPYDGYHEPRTRREHLMQLLLYMLIIRYNFHPKSQGLNAFLLYSKYEKPLTSVGFYPREVCEALRIRNGIAGLMIGCSREGGFDFLLSLKTDDLNMLGAKDKLWATCRKPIDGVLEPMHAATDLERSYAMRFLTFISKEHLMAKWGNKTKECSGFASAWNEILEAKLAAGNIYVGLQLMDPEEEQGGIKTLSLRYSNDKDNVMSNFRRGDIVVVYPYEEGTTPDLRTQIVFRATIEEIGSDVVRLRLRAPQTNRRVFDEKEGCLWAFEHDFMDSSFSSLYRGIHSFLKAPKDRRDLLLLQRQPKADKSLKLRGDYGDFNDIVLRVRQARDLFLIIGPPGTGKTSFGMLYNVKEELLEPSSSILIMSYTNRAVDEICSKFEEEGVDYLRIGSEQGCDKAYKHRLLGNVAPETKNVDELRQIILSTRVIVGTTTSINSRPKLLEMKTFSLCIVDEASQILEPHLVGILSATNEHGPSIGKLVMIGDHKQLPAVVGQDRKSSAVSNPTLNNIGLTNCRDSLFERLLRRYRNDDEVVYMLKRQGRMHENIQKIASKFFYAGQLTVADKERQSRPLPPHPPTNDELETMLLTRRVFFIDVDKPETSDNPKVNQPEADVIARLAMIIFKHEGEADFDPDKSLGIIVPYRNQIITIRRAIERLAGPDSPPAKVSIDTVERFQGSQRKYIIFGATVQRKYQLNFLSDSIFTSEEGVDVDRKLNVVVTRAQDHLIIVGHAPLLNQMPIYRRMLQGLKA